jgi:hypothetical protein
MSNFATAMNYSGRTWNGAVSLSSPDITGQTNGRISLFFKAVRGLEDSRLYEYLSKSALENITDTFLLAFNIRDCRGGKGERDLGRKCLVWLFLNYPDEFNCVAPLISEYGRWDDLMELWPGVLDLTNIESVREKYLFSNIQSLDRFRELQFSFVRIVGNQLKKDLEEMHLGNPITICAKWAPTEGDSLDRKYKVVETLTDVMGITPKTYRKIYTSPLRQYLKIVERYMCERKWDQIDYSKVPSCAMKRLKKAFAKNAPDEFADWKRKLSVEEVKVNAKQLFPHELIYEIRKKHCSDEVCEAQWKVLEEEAKKLGSLEDIMIVCDVSGSMQSWGEGNQKTKLSFCPMDVAIGLSLLVANTVKGVFHNHILTFHEKPSFHLVYDGSSLYDRYKRLASADWGGSTNLQATFDLILNKAIAHKLSENDMPKRLFIISDMQFNSIDRGSNMTNFEMIKKKYSDSGYTMPSIVFWNVCGSSTDFPVSVRDNGTALISGFSVDIMASFIDGKEFSPYSILRSTLDSERLEPIRSVLQ